MVRESEEVKLSAWSAVFFQKALGTSYMIPIVYLYIDSDSLSSSVPRYLAYLKVLGLLQCLGLLVCFGLLECLGLLLCLGLLQ